jgi:hypothetical protein
MLLIGCSDRWNRGQTEGAAAILWVAILLRLPDNASMFYGDFVLTMLCGGQAFACALALGHLVGRLRVRSRALFERLRARTIANLQGRN